MPEIDDGEPAASVWLATIRERLFARDYAAASQVAACAALDFPSDGRFWELGGIACWMTGETHISVLYLEEATLLKALHPIAQITLADGYAKLGKDDLAQTIWDFLIDPVGGRLLVSAPLQLDDQFDDLLYCTAFRTVTDSNPRNHYAWFGFGICLAHQNENLERIVEALAVAVRLAPNVVLYRVTLAEHCQAIGDHDRAEWVLGPIDPSLVRCPCLLRRACAVYLQIGDMQRADEYRMRINLLTSR